MLPPTQEKYIKGIRILILPDGNNRASLEGKTYNDGGKNVVRMAEALAERGDVSTMIACVLSADNVAKRSDAFFDQIYKAFVGLGIAIENEGVLVAKKIRLGYDGDLAGMRQKSRSAAKLADIIETVCGQTAHIQEPAMDLILGVNYDEFLALSHQVHAIYRSGMEEDKSIRLSGLRVNESMYNVGSPTYWPNVEAREVTQVIDDVKTRLGVLLQAGYSSDFILNLIERQADIEPEKEVSVTVPFDETPQKIMQKIDELFARKPDLHSAVQVVIVGKKGLAIKRYGGGDKKTKKIILVPSGTYNVQKNNDGSYTSILAPGQQSGFYLKADPLSEYATVFYCDPTPEGVVEGTRKAVRFSQSHRPLRGAERNLEIARSGMPNEVPDEFKIYTSLTPFLSADGDDDLEGLADVLHDPSSDRQHNRYNMLGDLLAAKILLWVRTKGITFDRPVELRAFINYTLTSYFLTYYPDHQRWDQVSENWQKAAESVSRYMALVYLMDDRLYDAPAEDPKQHYSFLDSVTKIFTASVEDKEIPEDELPELGDKANVVLALADSFRSLSLDLKASSNEKCYSRWKASMAELFTSHLKEWDKHVLSVTAVDLLRDDFEKKIAMFRSVLLRRCHSGYVRGKIEDNILTMKDGTEDEKKRAANSLKFYAYLQEAGPSIGAKPVYETLLAVSSPDLSAHPGAEAAYEELCYLNNMYYRLANDFAELYRASDDKEQNDDATKYLYRTHLDASGNSSVALIKTLSEIQRILKELWGEIVEKRQAFFSQYGSDKRILPIAVSFMRADIVQLFYKGTHYREAKREDVANFFEQLYNSGDC
ncbi:MAG TPA: hypothetical protein VI588_03255 [Candidatus Gracilibacteria bacterium]|nr:hypothetical protein [Candidatus Gracilibacteria bacterium]